MKIKIERTDYCFGPTVAKVGNHYDQGRVDDVPTPGCLSVTGTNLISWRFIDAIFALIYE